MDVISIMLFYDSSLDIPIDNSSISSSGIISDVQKDEIVGITYIDVKGNDELYKKLYDSLPSYAKFPLLSIKYKNETRLYPWNVEVRNQIKNKLESLMK